MLVSFYEKNSQNLHRYTAPSFMGGMGSLPIEAMSRGRSSRSPGHPPIALPRDTGGQSGLAPRPPTPVPWGAVHRHTATRSICSPRPR